MAHVFFANQFDYSGLFNLGSVLLLLRTTSDNKLLHMFEIISLHFFFLMILKCQ
jgi:hypothetical protein